MGPPSTARCFSANSVMYCSLSPHPKSMVASSPSISLTDSFPLQLFFGFSMLSLLLLFSLFAWRRTRRRILADPAPDKEPVLAVADTIGPDVSSLSALKLYLSRISQNLDQTSCQKNPAHLSQSFLIELLTSNSTNLSSLLPSVGYPGGVNSTGLNESRPADGEMSGEEPEGKKRKKKKGKNKKNKQSLSNPVDLKTNASGGEMGGEQHKKNDGSTLTSKEDLVCLYPFTTSSSATQRKIKQHYDQLLKSHDSKGLTLAQVAQFVDSLVNSRNELQQKSEVIRRRFTITKALLLRADRSSFDRLRQQLYKLEAEQKRLEEDAFVFNWLQHQLKLSPAYKKMLETNASREMEAAKSSESVEKAESETDFSDISFEELLAQEKKDSFWQKHGKQRLSSFS